MKTSRKNPRSWDPGFFLRALNLRKYLMYVPVNKVWLYGLCRSLMYYWHEETSGMFSKMHYSSRGGSTDTLKPVLHRLYCKMQSGAGAKSLIIGDGSRATFSHPYSVGFSSPSSNNVQYTVWRWTSMEVSSSVSRWQSFGFQSLTDLNQRLQGSVPKYRKIRCSIISVESLNKSSSLLAVPNYVFVRETVLIISASRCTSGDVSSFSTVGPLTKDCQSNVYKNRSDFCCGVLCCLCYLQEWILILYRHVCLKYKWSGRLFRPSCVFVIRLNQFVSVRV